MNRSTKIKMAAQRREEMHRALLEQSAELESLKKEKEELEADIVQMQNEYDEELEKKLQEIEDEKAKVTVEINALRGTRSQLEQVDI